MNVRIALASLLFAACAGSDLGSAQSALVPDLTLNMRGSPPEGGQMVLMIGPSLVDGATVNYGDVPAASVQFLDATQTGGQYPGLLTVTPPHAESFVDVVVTLPDGSVFTWPGFHFGPAPVITSFSPTSGLRTGQLITINGANFADTLGVQVGIGPFASLPLLSKSPTQLVLAAPKVNAGSYQMWVYNFDGQYMVAPGVIGLLGGGGGGGGGGK